MAIKDQINRIKDAKASIKEVVNQDFNKIGNEGIAAYPDLIAKTTASYKAYVPWKKENGENIVTFDNNKDYKVRELIIDGNSYQQTYSGKNLIENKAVSYSTGGVTFTKNSDGSFKLNGTATAGISIVLRSNFTLPAGTYTNSIDNIKSGLFYSFDNINNTMLNGNIDKKISTFTITKDTTYTKALIWIDTGTSFTDEIFHIQTEKGSVATKWEPYVGGVAAPNPDYPQEINVIEGVRNLFTYTKNNITSMGVTANSITNGGIKISGTATANYSLLGDTDITNLEIGTYILSRKVARNYLIRLTFYYIDNTSYSFDILSNTKETTINISKKVNRVTFNLLQLISGQRYDEEIYIQLEEGNTSHSYVPYGSNYLINKITGKNLFDKDNNKLINGLWCDRYNKKIQNNTAGNVVILPIKGGKTYTLSKKNNNTIDSTLYFAVCTTKDYPSNNIPTINDWVFGPELKKITISTSNDANYLFVGLAVGTSLTSIQKELAIEELQIEEGTQATEYEPYKQTIIKYDLQNNYLAKIGDNIDTLDEVSGILNRKIRKLVLDGSESYSFGGSGETGINVISHNIIDMKSGNYIDGACNYFKNNKSGKLANTIRFGGNNSQIYFYVRENEFSTKEQFQNWIKQQYDNGTPVTIYYLLKDSETIQLTPTQIPLFNDINNIQTIGGELSPSATKVVAESESVYTSWTQSPLYNK